MSSFQDLVSRVDKCVQRPNEVENLKIRRAAAVIELENADKQVVMDGAALDAATAALDAATAALAAAKNALDVSHQKRASVAATVQSLEDETNKAIQDAEAEKNDASLASDKKQFARRMATMINLALFSLSPGNLVWVKTQAPPPANVNDAQPEKTPGYVFRLRKVEKVPDTADVARIALAYDVGDGTIATFEGFAYRYHCNLGKARILPTSLVGLNEAQTIHCYLLAPKSNGVTNVEPFSPFKLEFCKEDVAKLCPPLLEKDDDDFVKLDHSQEAHSDA